MLFIWTWIFSCYSSLKWCFANFEKEMSLRCRPQCYRWSKSLTNCCSWLKIRKDGSHVGDTRVPWSERNRTRLVEFHKKPFHGKCSNGNRITGRFVLRGNCQSRPDKDGHGCSVCCSGAMQAAATHERYQTETVYRKTNKTD